MGGAGGALIMGAQAHRMNQAMLMSTISLANVWLCFIQVCSLPASK
jgi:hypothetical protein